MRLIEAYQALLDSYRGVSSPRTVQFYEERLPSLVEFLGPDRDIETITITDLRRWRSHLASKSTRFEDHPYRETLEGGYSPHTLHSYVRAVRRLFRWLVVEGRLKDNPAKRLEFPPLPDAEPKGVEDEDLAKLLDAARRTSERDYAIVCMLADTGCRVGGLVGMKLTDLDFTRGRVKVTEKGERTRYVFFCHETAKALHAYLRVRPRDKGNTLFVGKRGTLTGSGVYRVLKRLARKGKVEGRFNPHAFRHGAAIGMLENGADLATVSQIMGHRSVVVTAKFYTIFSQRQLQERHGKFSRLRDEDSQQV